MPPFESFVVLAEMRTGSNLLQSYLNACPGVTCRGELFNPSFVGSKRQGNVLGFDLAARDADPLGLLAALRAREGMTGFRLFHNHDRRVWDHVLNDPGCAKIVLTRNPLESHVSHKVAVATDQWMLLNLIRQRSATVRFDAAEFADYVQQMQQIQQDILHRLQVTGQSAFYIHYDDLNALKVVNGLLAWLGVEGRLQELPRNLKKQNPGPVEDKLENPGELAAGLSRIDRFDLGRTPNFEPRRGPMLNICVAPPRAPVMFMPLRGGPEWTLYDWLAAIDGVDSEALLRDFDHGRLRDWRRAHAVRRSFTVLRHPLRRAHLTFVRKVLSGEFRQVREHMARLFGVNLDELPAELDLAQNRAAFLAYLKFCKACLSGQTGLQPWPVWASQSALLDGFAEAGRPEVILREESLAPGLERLCAELGLPCPPVPQPESAPGHPPLQDIADDEVIAACRAAYWRDFEFFGFAELPE